MKIYLDGEEYTVPPDQEAKMLAQFNAMSATMYEQQGLELQLLATALVRGVLLKWERSVRKTQGKDASLLIRPPKGVEPVLHLSNLLVGKMGEMVKHAELRIETNGQRTTTAFNFSIKAQDQGGGSLVSDGNIGQRENDSAQVP